MDVRETYRSLREELLDRHSPLSAVFMSGFLSGLAVPLTAAAIVLALLLLGSLARLASGSSPAALRVAPLAVLLGCACLLYFGVAGALAAAAWRLGDRWGSNGATARFLAFFAASSPAGFACWYWLSGGTPLTLDAIMGALLTSALFAVVVNLVWFGHYLDLLDAISPVRWAEAAIRMLREDYYDDWIRYNQKMARFKQETQLVRAGQWDDFIRLEKVERSLLAAEEEQREREVRALLRPDLYPEDVPHLPGRPPVALTGAAAKRGRRRSLPWERP